MENVSYKENETAINLFFTVNGYNYVLVVQKPKTETDQPYALFVDHSYDNEKDSCPACGKLKGMICTKLDLQRGKWLQKLIDHPAIRLHWLYV